MDKRLLIHKVKWYKKRLTMEDKDGITLSNVRLAWQRFYKPLSPEQQTIGGNWVLYISPDYSIAEDANGNKLDITEIAKQIAIGDTIEYISAPVFPKTVTVLSVIPCPDVDPERMHHWEVFCL